MAGYFNNNEALNYFLNELEEETGDDIESALRSAVDSFKEERKEFLENLRDKLGNCLIFTWHKGRMRALSIYEIDGEAVTDAHRTAMWLVRNIGYEEGAVFLSALADVLKWELDYEELEEMGIS